MFNMSAFELLLIAFVALVVIGPERLPHVAQTLGKWVGQARRIMGNVQNSLMETPPKNKDDRTDE